MGTTIVALEKRVEFFDSKNRLLQQERGKILYRLRILQKLLSGAKRSVKGSVSNKLIEIAVKVEDAMNEWRGKEVSKPAHYGKHIDQN